MRQFYNRKVTMANSYTQNLKSLALKSDIIISAVGKPEFITEDYINNSVLIDVGINRISDGIVGDFDYKNVFEKASHITPVPGGIGPMTIAMLMENTFELFQIQNGYSD